MLEHQGTRDYALARRKAGARFGVTDDRLLPANDEIDAALRVRQGLFATTTQPDALRLHREAARDAMDFLSGFEPRLVGAALDGSADAHSPVCLHLFEDDVLPLIERLKEGGVEFEQRERRVRYAGGFETSVPLFQFDAGAVRFEVMLFARDGLREAPLDRIHQRPQRRASRAEVLLLL